MEIPRKVANSAAQLKLWSLIIINSSRNSNSSVHVLVSIVEVALRWARLLLGWVSVC